MDIIEQIRQGDILLVPINNLPYGFTKPSSDETIAVGEGRNHFHNLKQSVIYRYADQPEETRVSLGWGPTMIGVAEVKENAKIVHELPNGEKAEHDPLDVPPGYYLLKRQREYNGVDARIVQD